MSGDSQPPSPSVRNPYPMLYPKDPNVTVSKGGDSVVVRWRRKRAEGLGFVIFGLAFECVAFVTSQTPLQNGEPRSHSDFIALFVFFSVFAVPFIYIGLTTLFNTWTIIGDRTKVTSSTGPIWFGRRVTVAAGGLKQFFVSTAPHSNRSNVHALYVMDANDHVWTLSRSLPSYFAANQICHELADFYQIPDQPVFGVTTHPFHPGPRAS